MSTVPHPTPYSQDRALIYIVVEDKRVVGVLLTPMVKTKERWPRVSFIV